MTSVMARSLALLLLGWALFMAPALCAGGLLEHACGCESETEVRCDHEETCATDPCSPLVRIDADALIGLGAAKTSVALDALVDWRPPALPRARAELPPPPRRLPNLPYARSDRPLRI